MTLDDIGWDNTETLEIHIDYGELGIRDLRDFFDAFQRLYSVTRRMFVFYPFEYWAPGEVVYHAPNLVVSEAHTGNSVDITIGFSKRAWPKIKTKKGKTRVILPRWAAVLFVCGLGLQWGLDATNSILDIRDKLDKKESSEQVEQSRPLPDEILAELKSALAELEALQKRSEIHRITVTPSPSKTQDETARD